MLSLARVLKAWKDNGALHAHIPWDRWVDETVLLTKGGEVVTFLQVPGIDFECISRDELDAYTKRFEDALKTVDTNTRLYQVLFRHNRPEIPSRSYGDPVVQAAMAARLAHFEKRRPSLYSIEIYHALAQRVETRGALRLVDKIKASFDTSRRADLLEQDLDQAVARLKERVRLFTSQLADFLPARILQAPEAFIVLRRLLNPDPLKAAEPGLKYWTYVDYFAADSHIEAYRSYLRADEYYVRTVTLKDPPAQTWPLVLRKLYELPANYHIVSEWHPIGPEVARKVISAARRHHHIQKTSIAAHMAESANPQEMLVDESKDALVRSLGGALTDMEMKGTYFGEYTLTVVLYDLDKANLDRAVSEVYKAFASHDGAVYEETYNILNSYFAALPGGHAHNLRRLLLTNSNAADMSFIFSLSQGEARNKHLQDEYLALLETQHGTLYYMNLHAQDIAHSLVLGKTGSGKSFLLNFLATAAQKYGGYTYFFDLGGSFKGITQLFGGTYLKIGMSDAAAAPDPLAPAPVRINPFSLQPTPDNLEFLFAFARVLIEGHDGFKVSVPDERELSTMIRTVYELDPETRTLRNFSNLLPRHLSERLHKWVHADPVGQYAFLFDNAEDTLEISRFFCADFEGLDRYPTLVEPLLFYLLHRANHVIYDPALASKFKLFFIDEAWRFLSHPAISRYIVEALKTWRKKNAAIVLSTQSVDDLVKSDLLEVLVESCATKIFLANPSLNQELYKDVLKLPEAAIELIRALRPKGQLLMSKPTHTKVLNLDVDPRSYWLYTNDPNDNARRDEAIRRLGFERGLDFLEGVSR
jgi:type IV secretion/conjugal transfer VirB4 family ATPase